MKKKLINLTLIIMLFISCFCGIYFLHLNLFNVKVLLYSLIEDIFIACLFTYIILIKINKLTLYSPFEWILIFILMFLCGYVFSITVPTIIDRSLSFYVIESIDKSSGGITKQELKKIIRENYIDDLNVSEMRITEQLESGTIYIEDEYIKVTIFGHYLANFSRFFKKNLLPKRRLILNQYTNPNIDYTQGR